jgi:hypothetical protein
MPLSQGALRSNEVVREPRCQRSSVMHVTLREVLAVHVLQNQSRVPAVTACSSVVRTVAGPGTL